jgi:hypothetical protein
MISRSYTDFRSQQVVVKELSTMPYVGFENTSDLPGGWRFDIKRWCSPFDLRLPTLPKLNDASTQGVSESVYFLSGVGSVDLGDLEVLDIYPVQTILPREDSNTYSGLIYDCDRQWLPTVRHGTYYRYKTDYFYYGDNSCVEYLNSDDNRSNRNYIELSKTPYLDDPILAATFKRHPTTNEAMYDLRINQMAKFTGLYSSGEELETVTAAGKIIWANIDTTKREFIVDKTIDGLTRLFFNKDYISAYGVEPIVYSDLAACIYLGTSTAADYQMFRLPNFPVLADSSFHLYVASSSSWTEWTRVNSWVDLIWTDSLVKDKYFVDKDLGIVYFGATSNGGVPAVGRNIVVSYTVVPRIEYEEELTEKTIVATEADVNPVTQSTNQGFVCISHSEIEPASIVLAIDKSLVSGSTSLYGPIYAGSDYGLLRATVTSPTGDVVPNTRITFRMSPDDIGFLDGSTESTAVTDGKGNAYSLYQPPSVGDELGHYSTRAEDCDDPSYPGQRQLVIFDSSAGLSNTIEDIYLFQILKDDLILGYSTVGDYLLSLFQSDPPTWVPVTSTAPTWLTDTPAYGLPDNFPDDRELYLRWKEELTLTYDLKEFVEPSVSSPNERVEGRKVVVYQISGVDNIYPGAIDPVTGSADAVIPVKPLAINQMDDGNWRLVYPAGSLPSTGTTIGSYWVVSSRVLEFQASCWSPYYNRTIYSNKITVKVSLPDYMLGIYINDMNQEIPFGWKIIGEDNVAAVLNGATFITINPFSGPYPIIDLVDSGEETGDWADAPFRTANFIFNIDDTDPPPEE